MRLQTDPYALQAVIRSNQRRERIVQMKIIKLLRMKNLQKLIQQLIILKILKNQ